MEGVMKMLAIVVAVGGIAALILAGILILAHENFLGGTGAGYIRLSTSIFLLALVIMMFDKSYCREKKSLL